MLTIIGKGGCLFVPLQQLNAPNGEQMYVHLRGIDRPFFLSHFYKGGNFCDSLFACLDCKILPQWSNLLKRKNLLLSDQVLCLKT